MGWVLNVLRVAVMHFGESKSWLYCSFLACAYCLAKQNLVCLGYFLPLGFGNVVLRFLVFQFGGVFLFLLWSCVLFVGGE